MEDENRKKKRGNVIIKEIEVKEEKRKEAVKKVLRLT